MGSNYSTACSKFASNKLPSSSLLFSEFCEFVKQRCSSDNSLACILKSNPSCPLECDVETMETIVHLWCVKCLPVTRWQKISRRLKNQLIQDFLNTLYCTSHSFDEIFLLLFTNSKSRSFILGGHDRFLTSSSHGLRDIVEDILRYSLTANLKFSTYANGQKCLESIADFPLKTFSLCPCTRRPLYVAMYLGRPDVVQLLLKYGARIPYEDVCNCMQYSMHPMKNVMDILRVTYEINSKDNPSKSGMDRASRNILSIRLILVDVIHNTSLWMNVCDALQDLTGSEESYIPSLKHICRTQIRHFVRRSPLFHHPHVWKMLHLPKTLTAYINLDYYDDLMCQF